MARPQMTAFEFQPYQRALRAGLPHGDRQGFELILRADDTSIGLGEVAPLAEFGSESMADAEQALRQVQGRITEGGLALPDDLEQIPSALARLGLDPDRTPVTYGGVELCLLDLLARRRFQPLAQLLATFDDRPWSSSAIRTNALVSGQDPVQALRSALEARQRGFDTIKVKVGHLEPAGALQLLGTLRRALGPEVRLRADAGRAWSVNATLEILPAFGALDLEYLEEPCPDMPELLARVGGTRMAVDESACPARLAWPWLERPDPPVIIIKPLLFGGLLEARRFATAAIAHGVTIVLTSALEGPVGLAAVVHLAASLPGDLPACGLATATWNATGTRTPSWLEPRGGALTIPALPGIGVTGAEPETKSESEIRTRTEAGARPEAGAEAGAEAEPGARTGSRIEAVQ